MTTTPSATGTPPARRVDGSMSLLVDMMANTLDEAYAERAALRSGEASSTDAPSRRPRQRGVVTVAAIVVLGVVTGAAVSQVRSRQEADTGLRGQLAAEVGDRTAESDALDGRAEALRQELSGLREQALGADAAGRAVAARLDELGLASATTPVRGPGVVVTLDDAAPDPERNPETVEDGRIRDTDVQDTVNALWGAGAEAISINGQRLTALTAKRSAGSAVLVDLLPLKPPYVLRAVGPPAQLELGFLDGPVGRRLFDDSNAYGLRLEVRRQDELTLPGAADPDLRAASPVPAAAS
ncbi:MAG: hypothetical protein JWN08_1258 [Frankiales bacterium]|nr:hypothetical protein [Frankiales bacterium]